MRKLLTPFINFAINKAKRSRFIQNLFEAPFELHKFKKFGEFTDSFNITAIRPHEKDMAMSFYKEGLNRMSIADLQQQLTNSGLELTAFLPYIKEQHVRMVDIDILNQSKKHYPNISFIDFITPRIMIVLKKMGNSDFSSSY